MALIYFSIGSNIGNRLYFLDEAVRLLSDKFGDVILQSSVYETAPWGFYADTSFYNQVVVYASLLSPDDVLAETQLLEQMIGRNSRLTNDTSYHSRCIDIDILFYDSLIIHSTELTIPHPLLHKRNFVLVPLAEIAEEFVHPVLQQSIVNLLEVSDDEDIPKLVR